MSPTQNTAYRAKGVSLARGPALALGTFLVIAGLYFVYMEHGFPRLSQFPNGTAHINGKAFFGVFGLNGWSGELTVAAGGLLLFGAAQHLLAKTASLIVGVVFAGVGIWALANHHSALGLFAANIWTILFWFAAAALLLITALLPRTPAHEHAETAATESTAVPVAQPAPSQPVTRQPVAPRPAQSQPPIAPAPAATATPEPAVPGMHQPVTADTSTIIPERPPVRVRPSGGSLPDAENPASS